MSPSRPLYRRRALWVMLGLAAPISLCAVLWHAFTTWVAPGELIRYALRRLDGHPKLEWVATPVLNWGRSLVEGPPTAHLPSGTWGQQPGPLNAQTYDVHGVPQPTALPVGIPTTLASTTLLYPEQALAPALQAARAGDVLTLQPGVYKMATGIHLIQGGSATRPITVRAATPGTVRIESTATDGFAIEGPYWVFEGLTIQGVCAHHEECEHAFHVTGRARFTVLRNNRIEDFNAHIKVNGMEGQWPDHGIIQFNTLINHGPRLTDRPVSPIDVVGASAWWVGNNVVANFIKAQGNGISYGIFMKGGGKAGVIDGNQVVCTTDDVSQPGVRVGVSLGGGGTGREYCRDAACTTEHTEGRISNNVIADCNDYGIFLNRASVSLVRGNQVINTYGIDLRFPETSAMLVGNQVEGLIRRRDGASLTLF